MRKILIQMKNSIFFKNASRLLVVYCILIVSLEAKAWLGFSKEKGICESLVEPIISRSLPSLISDIKSQEDIALKKNEMDHAQNECYKSILSNGDYKELYAYYLFYKYSDEALTKYRTKSQDNIDPAPNNIYHYMLFYANQNSRDFDPKTNSFKKEQGLYEQELKDFEEAMTQEEKAKAFGYIADNLAVGKEGWVKVNDYQKSFEYLKKAAEAGDVGMQSALGASYFLGKDWMNKFEIEKNFIKGYKWMYLATIHSNQLNHEYMLHQTSLNKMKKMMEKYQIAESKKLIKIWLNQNKDFIKNHPLKITPMTKEEVASEKDKTEKFIKDYGLDQPLPTK